MVTKRKGKASEGTSITKSRPRIDLNESRRAAQNAMDAMRKNRIKYGRPSMSRRTSIRTNRRSV